MPPKASSVIAALFLGVAAVMFVPAMADAAGAIPYDSYTYGSELETVAGNLGLIMACIALVLLVQPFTD